MSERQIKRDDRVRIEPGADAWLREHVGASSFTVDGRLAKVGDPQTWQGEPMAYVELLDAPVGLAIVPIRFMKLEGEQ